MGSVSSDARKADAEFSRKMWASGRTRLQAWLGSGRGCDAFVEIPFQDSEIADFVGEHAGLWWRKRREALSGSVWPGVCSV